MALSRWGAVLAGTTALIVLVSGCGSSGSSSGANGSSASDQHVEKLTFDFPVAVAGPVAQDVKDLVNQFNQTHKNIQVSPVFTGDYQTTMTKVQTAAKAGSTPDVAVLQSTDMYSLLDANLILPIDQFATSDSDKQWLTSFYPALMANSTLNGKTYGIPFQRSTLLLYYNKDEFNRAGLDPNSPPTSWDELVKDGKMLTKNGQWGLEIPTSGLTYWEFQPFAIENGQNVVGDAANKVTYDDPKVAQALQFFADLSKKDKIEPTGLLGWTTAPTDFESGKAAMIYHSSGSLTSILKTAKFNVGVAELPGNVQKGSPTGGGNLYVFNTKDSAKEQAAYEFVKWMAQPDNAAKWSIETGYVGSSPAVYETDAMKQYLQKTPQAAAIQQQMQSAAKELGTHDGQEIQSILSTACQQVLTANVTPQQALKDAQQKADQILSKYQN
ncbi:ABC transporter substrate-binding protein [Alicyclobacillus dauci]|uniref:ABC transporter substrate-binding protein n=1 Tax=Alicyclobacillus dauci TaxID=1475485 RepID=A0ABY6Z5M8_9BACL|nr:ABC transporter substrate-binding protein [Alicyclobacillus dauci]WAH37589.1 ABC transporter substrate-binding protein [Alicyclobacillus dauci]